MTAILRRWVGLPVLPLVSHVIGLRWTPISNVANARLGKRCDAAGGVGHFPAGEHPTRGIDINFASKDPSQV